MGIAPQQVVASFDSASVLHAATVAGVERRAFPHLGNPPIAAATIRAAGRLPWPLLRRFYQRIGGAEGIDPDLLGRVDMQDVAAAFASAYPARRYPTAVVGASNGAVAHLATAMGAPWLPSTVLIPVHRVGDPDRPDLALEFGRRVAGPLLRADPDVVLHQMHDPAQDALMVARMSYLRTKWAALPAAYERFLAERLQPGAPVLLVDDRSTWPVTRVGERHVFQTGGLGGPTPEEHLAHPHAPAADDEAPEAEWGTEPALAAAVRAWCAAHGHPCVTIRVDGPQEAAHPVAVEAVRRHGAVPRFLAVDPRKAPHDIGTLGRYGPAMRHERDAPVPFVPLEPAAAIDGLRTIVGERGRPIMEEVPG